MYAVFVLTHPIFVRFFAKHMHYGQMRAPVISSKAYLLYYRSIRADSSRAESHHCVHI